GARHDAHHHDRDHVHERRDGRRRRRATRPGNLLLRRDTMAVTWEEIQEGMMLPRLENRPGVTQLVKYAAGSGDFNPLHHDYQFTQAKQLGSIIVHGRFKYAALGELVSNW